MLFKYTYLLEDFDPDFFDGTRMQTSDFIIPINDLVIGRKPKLFQTLHQAKSRFCFFIPAEINHYNKQFIKDEIILNLIRLLFLPNYLRINDKHIFFIEKRNTVQNGLDRMYNDFYMELKKQGITIIMVEMQPADSICEDFSGEHEVAVIYPDLDNYLSIGGKQGSFEGFMEKFKIPDNLDKKWIVPVAKIADFEKMTKLLEKFEHWLILSDPIQVKLIEMYHGAYKNNEKLRTENHLLKYKLEHGAYYSPPDQQDSHEVLNELSGLRNHAHKCARSVFTTKIKDTNPEAAYTENDDQIIQLRLQISVEQKRAQEILEWYKKEYEVLPMWYKRFGQIVKVLLGKRKFISLFK